MIFVIFPLKLKFITKKVIGGKVFGNAKKNKANGGKVVVIDKKVKVDKIGSVKKDNVDKIGSVKEVSDCLPVKGSWVKVKYDGEGYCVGIVHQVLTPATAKVYFESVDSTQTVHWNKVKW